LRISDLIFADLGSGYGSKIRQDPVTDPARIRIFTNLDPDLAPDLIFGRSGSRIRDALDLVPDQDPDPR
jgi:hypothetical protein